jgi:hypothetical protein
MTVSMQQNIVLQVFKLVFELVMCMVLNDCHCGAKCHSLKHSSLLEIQFHYNRALSHRIRLIE